MAVRFVWLGHLLLALAQLNVSLAQLKLTPLHRMPHFAFPVQQTRTNWILVNLNVIIAPTTRIF